ncbi:MAG: NAD(P)H-dependent glycerol-3-phosphate dehydrogenase [Methanobrevibacter sp.]|uniref:NAD(P)H-dependent glycerol-3-phosphate dehydrogenase n=1 Tax=Methanobrevibacter sp. TaxID=66852 RepID=UPI002E7AA68B|nr:NAD(P)H-dependent glycerol-3-phosphate dehydrogenase [Methanobrevibacter sp.]MEE0935639.1 NAD(P)H-dependent glycerol-3-phosphate dehydrogenase [Methanobrevibacter sp.]
MLKVGIIGAGALGTAIAQAVSKNLDKVYLYARRPKVVEDINNGYNKDYYPNVALNKNIIGINDLNLFKDFDCLILSIPSASLRDMMCQLTDIISKECIIVSTIKGIEKSTSKTASEVIQEFCDNPTVVLSGPNIAREIVLGLPAATTIAVGSDSEKDMLYKIFQSNEFKLQFNNDLIGTEFCGIIKNILAMSTGICEGLNVNDSAKFAILNKGFVETRQIIEKLNGNPNTILDYCGFGDIVTASTLSVSRNHTLGVLHGQKIVIDESKSGVVFEGKNAILFIKELCEKNDIESSIVEFVNDVIINKKNPEQSFEKLWENI